MTNSMRIYKYPIEITDYQRLQVPMRSEFLSAQFQGDIPCLWILVDTESEPVNIELLIIGTGNPVPDNIGDYSFMNTLQDPRGFVWHLFSKVI